ncbi:MAG: hypothetical protein U1E46_13800 [Hyphomicrobiales bacterium]
MDELSVDEYFDEIDQAEDHLERWMSKAPRRYFRHPLCAWGSSDEKRLSVRDHLAKNGYATADVSNWLFEWRWNRAYINSLRSGNIEGIEYCKHSFLEFSTAQLKYDYAFAKDWFGGDLLVISLGHTVPFFADVADALFSRFKHEGVEFISLDPAYRRSRQRQQRQLPYISTEIGSC